MYGQTDGTTIPISRGPHSIALADTKFDRMQYNLLFLPTYLKVHQFIM